MKAEAPQITHKGFVCGFLLLQKKRNGDEEHDDLLVLLTTLANAVFTHDP